MNQNDIDALRRDVDGLIKERDVLLGYISGLHKVVAALIQTHPVHADVNLAISLHRDMEMPLGGPDIQPYADQVLDSMLLLKPFLPGALQSFSNVKPR